MKKLLTSTLLTLALCSVANAYTSQDIDVKITAQEQKNEQYQNFIWDQEKINSLQERQNKGQEEFNNAQFEINKINRLNFESINSKLSSIYKAPDSEADRLRSKIRDLESEVDKLRSINSRIDQRLMTLERKVK